MNLLCFNSNFFAFLEKDFAAFFEQNSDSNTSECLIQDVMFHQVEDEGVKVFVTPTTSVWQGVTYKEDKEKVVAAIKVLVDAGNYPNPLWK